MEIILGMGSNVGDRAEMLRRAVAGLAPFVRDTRVSRVYESRALLPADAPGEWDRPFLNIAVAGITTESPMNLLQSLGALEVSLGRRKRDHWGPREIDIDILAYGDQVVHRAQLCIPHKEMLSRDFVLVPMADVAPGWSYPGPGPAQGKTVATLVRELGMGLPEGLKKVSDSL